MKKQEFIDIIDQHKNLIFKVCNSYCPNIEDRKDLEQEIILQLWRSLDQFDGRVKLTTWIYKIALNIAITHYRKDSKRKSSSLAINEEIFSLSQTDYDTTIDENIAILYKVIEELSKVDKAIILLYLENHKHREIAEILGISESNVATKIGRIKKSLKKKMSHYNTI